MLKNFTHTQRSDRARSMMLSNEVSEALQNKINDVKAQLELVDPSDGIVIGRNLGTWKNLTKTNKQTNIHTHAHTHRDTLTQSTEPIINNQEANKSKELHNKPDRVV